MVIQLVKKFPIYEEPGVYYCVQKTPPLEFVLSHFNPVHTLSPCFC